MKKVLIITLILVLCLCGCSNDFKRARSSVDSQKVQKELDRPKVSDLKVESVSPNYIDMSSYSDNIKIEGTVKNNSSKTISSCTLKLYVYNNNDELVNTETDYCFNITPNGEDTFSFITPKIPILVYDNYKVEVTEVS